MAVIEPAFAYGWEGQGGSSGRIKLYEGHLTLHVNHGNRFKQLWVVPYRSIAYLEYVTVESGNFLKIHTVNMELSAFGSDAEANELRRRLTKVID